MSVTACIKPSLVLANHFNSLFCLAILHMPVRARADSGLVVLCVCVVQLLHPSSTVISVDFGALRCLSGRRECCGHHTTS